jgi:ribonuclease Z
LIALILWICALGNISAAERSDMMRVTMLGTGTPFPNAERFGSAILVEAADKRLLFDCGRGAVVRLTQAGVSPSEIDGLFLTHLHSDHVVGIPDLWLSGWFLGRDRPLPVWGPKGTRSMSEHLTQAFAFDIRIREATPEGLPAKGAQIDAKEVEQGNVFGASLCVCRRSRYCETGIWISLGLCGTLCGHFRGYEVLPEPYRFRQRRRRLIHVAWTAGWKNPTAPSMRLIASAEDAGRVFATVRPKLGVIYHYKDEEGLWDAVHKEYKGPFVVAKDLMVINLGKTVTWHGRSSHSRKTDRTLSSRKTSLGSG